MYNPLEDSNSYIISILKKLAQWHPHKNWRKDMDNTDEYINVTTIIKFAVIVAIGLVLISNINSSSSLSKSSQVTLTFTKNPQRHETIQLGNTVYEFTDDGSVTNGHTPVHLGATLSDTVSNFKAVTNENYNVA